MLERLVTGAPGEGVDVSAPEAGACTHDCFTQARAEGVAEAR